MRFFLESFFIMSVTDAGSIFNIFDIEFVVTCLLPNSDRLKIDLR